MECTTAWDVDGAGDLTGELRGDAARRIGKRRGGQQRPSVRMGWGGEQLGGRGNLDDPPEVHHRHAVGEMLDDRQVVGDEDHGQSVLVAQRGEEVEDLRLDGNVERRDRLVGDEQPRLWRQAAAMPTRCR